MFWGEGYVFIGRFVRVGECKCLVVFRVVFLGSGCGVVIVVCGGDVG